MTETQASLIGVTSIVLDTMGLLDGGRLLNVLGEHARFHIHSLSSYVAPCSATFTSCGKTFYVDWKENVGVDADLGSSLNHPPGTLYAPGVLMDPNDLGFVSPTGSFVRTLVVRRLDPSPKPPADPFGKLSMLELIVPVGEHRVSVYGFEISHGPNVGDVEVTFNGICKKSPSARDGETRPPHSGLFRSYYQSSAHK
jgi:hypothetical protein